MIPMQIKLTSKEAVDKINKSSIGKRTTDIVKLSFDLIDQPQKFVP
jgi:hypothetical protein